MKTASQIRQDFLNFFQSKQHLIVPSAPLVPQDDATLMFINSGMAPFKKSFLGTEAPPASRVVDTQKCLRVSGKHNDLEEVGVDTYHHTFFEMLGNWSFGDYFKTEALTWSWELLTEVWGLSPDRLYVTVHEGEAKWNLEADNEAIELWKSQPNMNADHILFGSSKDNFWMMGDTGPCGPCSEIHYDGRSDEERAQINGRDLVNMDHPLVVEVWNNVFIQYNALPDGTLEPLKAKHVDTGMGFERMVRTIQGKDSNYDTDIFTPLLAKVADLSPNPQIKGYDDIIAENEDEREKLRIAMRVVVDHIRTVSFAICDGAPPSNDGRGYVIKRILRRAIRYGYQTLGLNEPFMWRLVETLKQNMGDAFPELAQQQSFIEKVIKGEEESFFRTLKTGVELFNKAAEREGKISGEAAFQLHDTYGFPIDLTKLMAREQGIDVDESGYEAEMKQQKDRARAASSFKVDQSRVDVWTEYGTNSTEGQKFVGYDVLEIPDAKIVATKIVTSEQGEQSYFIALDSTPFYAESGGQVGDVGKLYIGDEVIDVIHTKKDGGYIAHHISKLPENLDLSVLAVVDADLRKQTCRHHTATHLLHQALRETLGTHVQQKGSLVEFNRLRFDFSHFQKVESGELATIEARVNELIAQALPLQEFRDLPISEAKERGAMALFGEKYGDSVRMIQFGDSKELCGGTHVPNTSEVNLFKFVSEGSVASGVRRVEAVVGEAAHAFLAPLLSELRQSKAMFKSNRLLMEEVGDLQEKLKIAEKEIAQLKQQGLSAQLDALISQAQELNGIRVVTGKIEGADGKTLGELAQTLRDKLGANAISVLGATDGEKVFLAATVSDDLNKQGKQAGKLVGEVAKLVGGGGGGRPQLATAGGKQPENLDAALASVAKFI